MSYTDINCMEYFTPKQGERMRNAITTLSYLQQTVTDNCLVQKLSSIEQLCYANSQTLTISNISNNSTTWQASSNVIILSSNNSSITIKATSSNSTGNGWIKATISNGVILQENFEVGVPYGYNNWNVDIHPYPGNIQGGLYLNNWTRVWVLESPGGNWNWTANYSMIQNANSSQILIKPLSTGYLTIKARLENECGCGNWLSKNYYVTEQSGGGHHLRKID